jgi:hypothetical protein
MVLTKTVRKFTVKRKGIVKNTIVILKKKNKLLIPVANVSFFSLLFEVLFYVPGF